MSQTSLEDFIPKKTHSAQAAYTIRECVDPLKIAKILFLFCQRLLFRLNSKDFFFLIDKLTSFVKLYEQKPLIMDGCGRMPGWEYVL